MPRMVQIETWFFGIIHCTLSWLTWKVQFYHLFYHGSYHKPVNRQVQSIIQLPAVIECTVNLLTVGNYETGLICSMVTVIYIKNLISIFWK